MLASGLRRGLASLTLSAASPTLSLTLPVALSTLPSALRLLSSVRLPAASLRRRLAFVNSSVAHDSPSCRVPSARYPIGGGAHLVRPAQQLVHVLVGDPDARSRSRTSSVGASARRGPVAAALVDVVVDPRGRALARVVARSRRASSARSRTRRGPSKVRHGSSPAGSSRMWGRYSLAFSSQPVAQTSSNVLGQTDQASSADGPADAVQRRRRSSGSDPANGPCSGVKPEER